MVMELTQASPSADTQGWAAAGQGDWESAHLCLLASQQADRVPVQLTGYARRSHHDQAPAAACMTATSHRLHKIPRESHLEGLLAPRQVLADASDHAPERLR